MYAPNIVREWGEHRILADTPHYKVKELTLLPGKSLSKRVYHLQKHWFILSGQCTIQTEYQNYLDAIVVYQGHSYCIGPGVLHYAENTGEVPCYILEVRYGETKGAA